jgi:hypothetical protein
MNLQTYAFEALPDGRYLVRFIRDLAEPGKFVLGIYQVTFGE